MDDPEEMGSIDPMQSSGAVPIQMKPEHRRVIDSILGDVVTSPREARMASDEEFFSNFTKVSVTDISPIERGGVVVYSDKVHALVDDSDGHVLVTGSSGSLKSTYIAIPSIYVQARAGENLVIADCKGELYEKTRWIFEELGYDIKKIDIRRPEYSVGWNPLLKAYYAYRSGDIKKVSEAIELVENYAFELSPVRSTDDPFWDEAGADVLKGAMILLFRICKDPKQVTIRNLLAVFSFIINNRSEFGAFHEYLDSLDHINTFMDVYFENSEKTGSCIMQMARKAVTPFAGNEYISSIMVDDDIDFRSMLTKKTVVFICVPDEKATYHSIVSMFVQQMYASLVDLASDYPDKRLPIRFNLILDEFASFPAMPNIAEMVSACRSRNIRFMFIIQALSQLRSKYGRDTANIILGNCTTNFFLNSREEDMLSYYSFLCGQDDDGKPLMDAYRLQRLSKDKGEALVLFGRENPYITNLVRFSDWAGPAEDWRLVESAHPIQPFMSVDVGKGIKELMAVPGIIYLAPDPVNLEMEEFCEQDPSQSEFHKQRFIKAVNTAIDRLEDPYDPEEFSRVMMEEFLFLFKKKDSIIQFLQSMADELRDQSQPIHNAYWVALKAIREMDQDEIDSFRMRATL